MTMSYEHSGEHIKKYSIAQGVGVGRGRRLTYECLLRKIVVIYSTCANLITGTSLILININNVQYLI